MTTVDKAHELFMSFKGRSPQQIYEDACKELGVKANSDFHKALSTKVDDFYDLESLQLRGNYFGLRGSLAVIPIVQCQQRLKELDMSGCGVGDECVKQLVDVLQDHPLLRSCDLSHNPDISVYSGHGLVQAARMNPNLIELELGSTHVGENVASVLRRMCGDNRYRIAHFIRDDWFVLKDMFIGLDIDGSGWVNIKNVVGSVPYPMIREKFEQRIKDKKPKKREDNCVDINSFMELAYVNYKNLEEIASRPDDEDKSKQFIIMNWGTMIKALAKHQVICKDVHRIRIRNKLVSESFLEDCVENAIKRQKEVEGTDAKPVELNVQHLLKAYRELGPASMRGRKHSSFLSVAPGKTRTWQLPPPLVSGLMKLFEDKPPQGMEAAELVKLTVESDMENIKLANLKEFFSKFAIPLEEVLTMQEVVNLVDEKFDVLRVDKPINVAAIEQLVASL